MAAQTLTWQIGNVRVTRVVEIELPGLTFILPDATPKNCSKIEWLFPHFVTPEGEPIAAVQTFVVESQGTRIMVDTCIGNDKILPLKFWNNLSNPFLADMAAAGFPSDSIDTVLCTHLHPDHIGWNTKLENDRWVPTFPGARYLFGKTEMDHFQGSKHNATMIEQSLQPILDADLHTLVETDHQVTDQVSLEPTPGHTPGHVSVRIRSEGHEAVITGDLLHHPAQVACPHWQCTADHDADQAQQTRERFIKNHADVPTLVIGTHFAAPTAGHIVKEGNTHRFVV